MRFFSLFPPPVYVIISTQTNIKAMPRRSKRPKVSFQYVALNIAVRIKEAQPTREVKEIGPVAIAIVLKKIKPDKVRLYTRAYIHVFEETLCKPPPKIPLYASKTNTQTSVISALNKKGLYFIFLSLKTCNKTLLTPASKMATASKKYI